VKFRAVNSDKWSLCSTLGERRARLLEGIAARLCHLPVDHGLETIRMMAIERVKEGASPSEVIAGHGFSRTTIYKWIKAAIHSGRGINALRSTKATGRPRTLTASQERQVFRWINGRDPRQYGLDFGLWTRKVVAVSGSG
jgi:Winged helix-turn helix